MRKMILLIVVAFLATADSFAQSLWDSSLPDRRLSFGITAGLNYARTDMDYANSIRPSFHAGATIDYAFVKSLSVRAALLYTEKGFKSNFGKASAGYVELPLQASYHIVTPTGVEFLLNVGPYFAYGISGKTQYEPEDLTFKYAKKIYENAKMNIEIAANAISDTEEALSAEVTFAKEEGLPDAVAIENGTLVLTSAS